MTLGFGNHGGVFGLVLLYLLGIEAPCNMGAELVPGRRSAAQLSEDQRLAHLATLDALPT